MAAVTSKAVVQLLFIRFLLLLTLWDSVIVLCFVVRYFLPIPYSFAIVLMRKERAGCYALFVSLVSRDCCLPSLHCVTRIRLQFVVVVCPDHTDLLFL